MHIALDTQPLRNPQKTGHAYYIESVLAALQARGNDDFVQCMPKQEHDLRTVERIIWDQIQLPKQARAYHAELLVTTAFSVPTRYERRGMKVVAIVHDLSLRRFPQNMRGISGWFLRTFVPRTFARADHLVAISQATKDDLMSLLHIPAEKISVVHSGVDSFYQPSSKDAQQEVLKKFNLPEHFLLWVGTLEPRKNLPFLIRALAPVLREKNIPLVLVGKRGWQYEEIFQAAQETETEQLVQEVGYVSAEEKRALYSAATLFVYPSLYEGFGMPVLEAQACGCPVIAADTSSLPEVVGQGGRLVPLEASAWSTAVAQLLENEAEQTNLITKGFENTHLFTWEKTAQLLEDIFHAVVSI